MPIGFIPRMASKVGTAVCGTACTVVCEVAWGTNPHAPTRFGFFISLQQIQTTTIEL